MPKCQKAWQWLLNLIPVDEIALTWPSVGVGVCKLLI